MIVIWFPILRIKHCIKVVSTKWTSFRKAFRNAAKTAWHLCESEPDVKKARTDGLEAENCTQLHKSCHVLIYFSTSTKAASWDHSSYFPGDLSWVVLSVEELKKQYRPWIHVVNRRKPQTRAQQMLKIIGGNHLKSSPIWPAGRSRQV